MKDMFALGLFVCWVVVTACGVLVMAHAQNQLVAQQADQLELQRETVAMMRVQLNILREHEGPSPSPRDF